MTITKDRKEVEIQITPKDAVWLEQIRGLRNDSENEEARASGIVAAIRIRLGPFEEDEIEYESGEADDRFEILGLRGFR